MNVPFISQLKTIDLHPLKDHMPPDFDALFVIATSKQSSNKVLV
jgi:hypothetical protein